LIPLVVVDPSPIFKGWRRLLNRVSSHKPFPNFVRLAAPCGAY
jgi:hypothetical protein